jgi:hypothetical protein
MRIDVLAQERRTRDVVIVEEQHQRRTVRKMAWLRAEAIPVLR